MIRHNDILFNPIGQTRDMAPIEFAKYIALRENSTFTDLKTLKNIREKFYTAHKDAPKEELDRIWSFIQPMVKNNSALAQFIIDYGGAESDYFFPWLKSVATSPSEALEMAYGAGYGIDGIWCSQVPEEDNISDFVHNVPTFVFQRERQYLMADLVSWAKDKGANGNPTKVVDLGAGRMAWSRYHGFQFDKNAVTILAVDKDTTVKTEKLFENPEALGITYEKSDILPWLAVTTEKDIDLVMLGGVASYFPLPAFTEAIIKPVYRIIKPGGVFFFDLQLDCLQYEWTIKLFDWPELQLEKSAGEAIAKVENIRRQLWESGLKFGAEYSVDTSNASRPSAIMVTFQKL